MNISDHALAVVSGIQYGVYDWRQAVTWADSVIAEMEQPPVDVIELALAKDKNATITWLNKLSTNGSVSIASAVVLGYLAEALDTGQVNKHEVAKILYFMSQDEFEPNSDIGGDMLFFWDGLYLAEKNVIDRSAKQVEQQMRHLLAQHKA